MRDAAAALQRARPSATVYDRRRKLEWAQRLQQRWVRCGGRAGCRFVNGQWTGRARLLTGAGLWYQIGCMHPQLTLRNSMYPPWQAGDLHRSVPDGPRPLALTKHAYLDQ